MDPKLCVRGFLRVCQRIISKEPKFRILASTEERCTLKDKRPHKVAAACKVLSPYQGLQLQVGPG